MASEKPKQEDHRAPPPSLPQRNTEMEFFDLAKGTTDSVGIIDDLWPPFPYFHIPDVHGLPQPCVEEALLRSINSMDNSQFKLSQSPPNICHDFVHKQVSNISCLGDNAVEFGQGHGHGDLLPPSDEMPIATLNKDLQKPKVEREVEPTTTEMAKGLDFFRERGEANRTHRHSSWSVQNQTTRGSTAPWSDGTQIDRQNNAPVSTQNLLNRDRGIKNEGMMRTVQPNLPPILDGSFLNLGLGFKTETRFNSDISSKDSSNMGGASPQLCTDFRQQGHSGYLDPCFKMDSVFSSVTDNASRFNNPVQKDGGFSSLDQGIDRFSGAAEKVRVGSCPVQSVNEFSSLVPFSHQSQSVGVSHQPQNVNRRPAPVGNFGGFSGLAQNMNGFSNQALKFNERSSCFLNSGTISSQSQNVGRLSPQAPNVDRSSRLLQNVDQFSGLAPSRGGTTMPHLVDNQRCPYIKNDYSFGLRQNQHAGFAGGDPSTGLQGFPTGSLMLQNSNPAVMSGYGLRMETGFLPSPLRGGAIQGAYGQLQNHHIGIGRSSSPEQSLNPPFVELSRQDTTAGQLFRTNGIRAALAGEGDQFSRNIGVQHSTGQPFQTNDIIPALAAEGGHFSRNLGVPQPNQPFRANEIRAALVAAEGGQFSRNLGVQQFRNLGPSPTDVSLQQPNSIGGPACTTGQQILAASGSSQASDLPQLSRKRVATELSHSTPKIRSRKIRKLIPSQVATSPPPVARSIPPIAQTSRPCLAQSPSIQPPQFQIAPSPHTHQTQTPPSRTNLAQIAASRSLLAQIAASRKLLPRAMDPSPHIKQQDVADETPQLSGRQCHICKRDLSYEPEGPVYQPKNPPPVAVLPCKHHFHDHCLELITTKDQADNPPCIPCALGEGEGS